MCFDEKFKEERNEEADDIGGNQWVEVLILRFKKRGSWTAHKMSDQFMVPADSTRRQSFASSEKVIPFSYLEEGVIPAGA